MRLFTALILCFLNACTCFATDFDVIVVGSSPICLLEALYRYHTGNRVLIVEESKICGGAWKSIEACGIPHADLGCHLLGSNKKMALFLEQYVGCHIVSMDHPELSFESARSPNGFYCSKGCFEMVDNLLQLIQKTNIVLLTEHKLESVIVDSEQAKASVKINGEWVDTSKIIVTPYSEIHFENYPSSKNEVKNKYYHFYLLIKDPTPPRFTYHNGIGQGVSRVMNLSPFVGIDQSGMQLIVLQTNDDRFFKSEEVYLDLLKKQNLIDSSASFVAGESYIYEQARYKSSMTQNMPYASMVFETLDTTSIQGMGKYITKWQAAFPSFEMVMSD